MLHARRVKHQQKNPSGGIYDGTPYTKSAANARPTTFATKIIFSAFQYMLIVAFLWRIAPALTKNGHDHMHCEGIISGG
jgi:hypothetical protein